jgi:hypothetical protein
VALSVPLPTLVLSFAHRGLWLSPIFSSLLNKFDCGSFAARRARSHDHQSGATAIEYDLIAAAFRHNLHDPSWRAVEKPQQCVGIERAKARLKCPLSWRLLGGKADQL